MHLARFHTASTSSSTVAPALPFVTSLPLHNLAFGKSGILVHAARCYLSPIPLRWSCDTLMFAVSFHLSARSPHVRILDVPVPHRIHQHWRCPSLPNQLVLCCCLPVTKPIAQTVSQAMGPSSRACHPIPVDHRHHGQLASFTSLRIESEQLRRFGQDGSVRCYEMAS